MVLRIKRNTVEERLTFSEMNLSCLQYKSVKTIKTRSQIPCVRSHLKREKFRVTLFNVTSVLADRVYISLLNIQKTSSPPPTLVVNVFMLGDLGII